MLKCLYQFVYFSHVIRTLSAVMKSISFLPSRSSDVTIKSRLDVKAIRIASAL